MNYLKNKIYHYQQIQAGVQKEMNYIVKQQPNLD